MEIHYLEHKLKAKSLVQTSPLCLIIQRIFELYCNQAHVELEYRQLWLSYTCHSGGNGDDINGGDDVSGGDYNGGDCGGGDDDDVNGGDDVSGGGAADGGGGGSGGSDDDNSS